MKIEEIIQDKLNQLERSLNAQEHLTNPTEFATQIASFGIYIHLIERRRPWLY